MIFFFFFVMAFFCFTIRHGRLSLTSVAYVQLSIPNCIPGLTWNIYEEKYLMYKFIIQSILVNFETTFLLKNNLNRKKNSNRILYTVTLYIFINTKSSTYVFVTSGKVYKNIVKFFRFVFLFSYLKTKSLLNHQLSVHILQIQLQNNFHVKLYVHGTHKSNTLTF